MLSMSLCHALFFDPYLNHDKSFGPIAPGVAGNSLKNLDHHPENVVTRLHSLCPVGDLYQLGCRKVQGWAPNISAVF